MRTALNGVTLLVFVLGAASCNSDVTTPEPDPTPMRSVYAGCGDIPDQWFKAYWCDNLALDLVAVSAADTSNVNKVAKEWNAALHPGSTIPGVPYFSSTAPGRHRIAVGHQSGTTNFAGQVLPPNPNVTPDSINMAAGTNGAFLPVLFVESSHVVGFNDPGTTWEKTATAGITDHCVRYATTQSPVNYTNTKVCQHEVEGVYAGYGLRDAWPSEGKHIVTSIDGLPSPGVTLHVGETFTVEVTGLRFKRANPAFCGSEDCTRPASGAAFNWTRSGSAISLSGTQNAVRTITANTVGAATVTVTFASSDTNEVTALFGTTSSRNSFTVTVLSPPPPPGPSVFTIDVSACKTVGSTVRHKLIWQPGGGVTYEIRHGTVDDVAQSALMSSGPGTTSSVFTPFYSMSTPPLTHYWWIREISAGGTPSAWLPNGGNDYYAPTGCVY